MGGAPGLSCPGEEACEEAMKLIEPGLGVATGAGLGRVPRSLGELGYLSYGLELCGVCGCGLSGKP